MEATAGGSKRFEEGHERLQGKRHHRDGGARARGFSLRTTRRLRRGAILRAGRQRVLVELPVRVIGRGRLSCGLSGIGPRSAGIGPRAA